MNFRKFLNVCLLVVFLGFMSASGALAQQVPLNPTKIPQFVDPLPLLSVQTGGTIDTFVQATGGNSVTLEMTEFDAKVLPTGTFVAGQAPLTKVWGYRRTSAGATGENTYIGPVIVANRGTPLQVTYVNNLGTTTSSQLPFWKTAIDQTLHWANPANVLMTTLTNYVGPIPAVAHLHGGEVPPVLDGGPDAWFLSQSYNATDFPSYTPQGPGYYTKTNGAVNQAIYNYPNSQEAAPAWFHDHTLGATRLNVYAGLAGAYIITDNTNNSPPADLNDPTKIIPLVIQDRMFDTTGQLFFPSIGLNPTVHPFWVPEFVGNVIAVNGKVWPFFEVGPNKYRFLLLNGSNARAYTLDFKVQGKGKSPTFWVISTDGGYLQNPVPVQTLTLMPGERYGVIIDFSAFKAGTTLTLQNSARTPFPGGAPVQGTTTGRVMQFRMLAAAPDVNLTLTYTPGANSVLRPNPIQRLVNANGTPAVTAHKTRLLTLNEVIGAGGPLEILVNNSKWDGLVAGLGTPIPGSSTDRVGNYVTEVPQEGETELWEIVNLTADAHPIHLHLVQFQLMNRQAFDLKTYTPVYDGVFPGIANDPVCTPNVYCPGYGPPLNYGPSPASGNKFGGNPDVTPYLVGAAVAPLPQELGWKDTVIMYPGEVTRIMVRWTPTDVAVGTDPTTAAAAYPFNPNALNQGYVWHCHIVDHEDNEMMRPTLVTPNIAETARTFRQGANY
jgi:spore coat protein A